MTTKNGNNLENPVPAFCLAVEEYRRTDPGRGLRSATEFRGFLFPYDEAKSTDNVFHRMPNDVRGPILSAWGIRGSKSALKDTDEKVQSTVHDSFVAGDIDDAAFEDGLEPDVTVRWLDLATWWGFVRGGKLDRPARRMMLETAYRLGLFDAAWFFENLASHGGRLHGTDAVAETLSKSELSDWIKKIHEGGDGSPKGVLEAVGWEKVAEKTAVDALDGILDAMAKKNGLGEEPLKTVRPDPDGGEAAGDGETGKPPPAEDPEIANAMSALDVLSGGRADPKAGEAAGAASGTAAAADAVDATTPTEADRDDQTREQRRPSDAPSVSFSEEPLDAGDRSSSMDVDDAELLAADGGTEDGGEPAPAAIPPATVDWGEHAPDPRKSADEAAAHAARNPRGSTSSVSYTPTPSSPRGREATLPSRPPPLPPRPQPPRRPPLPKGKGR